MTEAGVMMLKEKILRMLMDNYHQYISGEEMCTILGVSRTAVWKHIYQLKEEGYVIQSSPKKGYMLVSSPDLLREEDIKPILDCSIIGSSIKYYDTIGSTNVRAKELAMTGVGEGTVVIGEEQTLGRGRLGRTWSSVKGKGIWMSIILRPNIIPGDAPKITQLAALSVVKGIKRAYGINPLIKWPNDVVIDGKKVCGILTEMGAEIDKVDYIIVGIGINTNHVMEDFPSDITETASSIRMALGDEVSRKEIVKFIFEELEELYKEFCLRGSLENFMGDLIDYSATVGREVRIINNNNERLAQALTIDTDGSLVVLFENGEKKSIISGEVSVRGLKGYV